MSVDMTKWQEIAKEKVHCRPAGTGRLAGKITIVTGAAQGFGKGLTESDADVLHGVMIINIDIALALEDQIEPAVSGQEGQHVVQKAAAAVHRTGAAAVQIQIQINIGLRCLAGDGGSSHGRVLLVFGYD